MNRIQYQRQSSFSEIFLLLALLRQTSLFWPDFLNVSQDPGTNNSCENAADDGKEANHPVLVYPKHDDDRTQSGGLEYIGFVNAPCPHQDALSVESVCRKCLLDHFKGHFILASR